MLVKPDMVSPFLHVVTIGVAFVLHRIISTLRILRPVESESASQASSRNHHCSHLQGHRTLISLPSILYFLLPDIPGIKLSRLHMQKEGWKGRWTHLWTRLIWLWIPSQLLVFENVGWDAYLEVCFQPFPSTSATQLVCPLNNVADVEAIKVGWVSFPC